MGRALTGRRPGGVTLQLRFALLPRHPTDGRRATVQVTYDQENCGSEQADHSKQALHANSSQHSQYGNRCRQAEDHHRIATTDRLYDLAPQLGAERTD